MTQWTSDAVERRLREAAVTLWQLPPDRGLWPAQMRAIWPSVVHEWGAYGWDPAVKPRVLATAEAISRLDQTCWWVATYLSPEEVHVQGMAPDTAAIMWMRVRRVPWHDIARRREARWGRDGRQGGRSEIPKGNSHVSLRAINRRGIAHLAIRLGQHLIPPDPVPGAAAPPPAEPIASGFAGDSVDLVERTVTVGVHVGRDRAGAPIVEQREASTYEARHRRER
jgi:hypothetical protein